MLGIGRSGNRRQKKRFEQKVREKNGEGLRTGDGGPGDLPGTGDLAGESPGQILYQKKKLNPLFKGQCDWNSRT